nr:hypothetical protein [Tanacetum cinerariifolium]
LTVLLKETLKRRWRYLVPDGSHIHNYMLIPNYQDIKYQDFHYSDELSKLGSTTIPATAIIVTTAVLTQRAKGIVFHEQEQLQIPTISSSKDKCKGKMIEPEVPIKKKDQMRINEEYDRKLEAKEPEATRLSKTQQDEEANNSWDNIQAMMDADRLLGERLQVREREEFSEVQKARLLVELIEKKIKHFL